MASSAGGGAATAKHSRVLLRFTSDTLRIPNELAAEIGCDEALIVGPSSGKARPWCVAVERDGNGAFLGRGWLEFAAACGVGTGWLLVLRHRGRGILTVKAFDASSCLREPAAPPAAVEATASSQGTRKLQFIRVLPTDFMEKMLVPAKFVQQYIPKEHLNNCRAIVFGPLGKVSHIEIEMNQLDVFFSGGWTQFLVFHDITESNALLLRYEGNLVFTVKVFEPNGCQRESKGKDIRIQQNTEEQKESPSISIHKNYKNDWSSNNGQKKPKGPMTRLSKAPFWTKSVFEIGPPSWMKKQINANALSELAVPAAFCDAIELQGPCTITLKTSMRSTESWQVHALPRGDGNYRLRQGWSGFCKESNLKLGDICTFEIVKTTLWLVAVKRCKENANKFCYQEKPKRKNDRSSGHGKKRPKISCLNKEISRIGCVFEIGPPAWMKKEINTSTIRYHLSLPLSLCEAIGLREPCMVITLKTSGSSTSSWQARLFSYKNGNRMSGLGWKRFCYENRIKPGDVCTIKMVETTLWHVIIERQ